jgi:hypothetical protein
MKELASDNFIIPDDSIISKNKRDYYRLNPALLNNPIRPSAEFIPRKIISDKLIQELLQVTYSDRSIRYTYFRNKIHRINFITFLKILQKSAVRHNLNIITRKLDWYILETLSKEEIIITEAKKRAWTNILSLHPRLKERPGTVRTSMGTILFNNVEDGI